MRKSIGIAAMASVALAACAMPADNEFPLTGNPHDTDVRANGNRAVVSQDPIVVRGPAVITWNVRSSGYEFPPDAITFNDPAGQFSCTARGVVLQCQDAYTQKGSFKYTIRVRNLTTGAVAESDPFVMND
ncbi:MAG TPA: hypothetical protein VFJ70_11510 [Burkholderiales bacterium]|nr:hypothetical protein [Burkholderiales bacterium]